MFQVIRTLSEDAFLFWKSLSGVRKNTEIVPLPYPIGVAVSEYGKVETRVIKIHHSKNRTHIVPKEELLNGLRTVFREKNSCDIY